MTIRQRDYFGTTVNLANRAVGIAPPATIAVTSEFADRLAHDVPREHLGLRALKGFIDELDFVLLRP